MAGVSLRCFDCGSLLRTTEEAQTHSELTGHANFAESTDAVLNIVCTACGKPCRSKTETDLHTKRTGHADFVDKTSETATPIDLDGSNPSGGSHTNESGGAKATVPAAEVSKPEEMVVPEVDKQMLADLEAMGFSTARATRGLHYSGNSSMEGAIHWIAEHEDDLDIEEMPLVPANVAVESGKSSFTPEELRLKAQEPSEMWELQGEDYCLHVDSTIDACHSLWDEVDHNEGSFLYMLEEQTPVKDCFSFPDGFADLGDYAGKEGEESKESSKRRRVLCFSSDSKNKTDIDIGSHSYLKSNMTEDLVIGDTVSENLQWDGQRDSGLPDDEVFEQSSEEWLVNCYNESEMQCSHDEMNSFTLSDPEIDFSASPPQRGTSVEEAPTGAPKKILKSLLGKKSFIRTPMKLTTSVVYPFALVKPCGVQGDVTLKDINQRIHAPAPRCKNKGDDPSVSYPTSAFSGKPVVVKTKIQTEGGKGSITIMRTKG